jgi:anaerobic selenocysteine-containing dehydrogenase
MSATTTVVRTSCNRDCPDACGILAHVRDGRVVRLQVARPLPRAQTGGADPHGGRRADTFALRRASAIQNLEALQRIHREAA